MLRRSLGTGAENLPCYRDESSEPNYVSVPLRPRVTYSHPQFRLHAMRYAHLEQFYNRLPELELEMLA
jgi:hypothetical protein